MQPMTKWRLVNNDLVVVLGFTEETLKSSSGSSFYTSVPLNSPAEDLVLLSSLTFAGRKHSLKLSEVERVCVCLRRKVK